MKIFVSYSRKDKNLVKPLVDTLEEAGVKVWIDSKRLEGATTVWKEIASAIEDFDWFLPVLSTHSLTSEWFHREVRKAYRDKPTRTIPVRITADLDVEEFPRWIAEKHAPLITEPEKILKALDYHTYDNLVSRARNHHRNERFVEAVESYREAIREAASESDDPKRDASLYIALSSSLESAGNAAGALEAATMAIDVSPSAASYLRRATCAFLSQDIELALSDFRRCLDFDPENASALNGLGVALFKHRRAPLSEIADVFRRALRIHESTPLPSSLLFKLSTHLGFALEKLTVEEPDNRDVLMHEAVDCFRTATNIAPHDKKTRFSLAYLEHQLGNVDTAIQHYQQSITEEFIRPLFCLGYAFYENQRYNDATQVFMKGADRFQKAGELDAHVGCIIGIVRCLLKQERSTEAIRIAEKALSLKGDDTRGLLVLAEAQMMHGEPEKAAITAQRVADQKCVRASDLLARICGTNSTAGQNYAREAATLRGEERPFWKTWFGLREMLAGADVMSFEPADVINADSAQSICQKRGWGCGDQCCF